MSKPFFAILIAATAMTATVAEARTNARDRGMASGKETAERAATRDLNAQQLGKASSMTAMNSAAPGGQSMAPDAGSAAPMAPDAGAAPMGSADTAAPMTPGDTGPAQPSDMTAPADPAAPPR